MARRANDISGLWVWAAILLAALPALPASAQTSRPASAPRKVYITVGKDTTYFPAPILPDGTADYAAYINSVMSRGVTPETNAAVLVMQALGPEGLYRTGHAEARALIGAPDLPAGMKPFVPYGSHAAGTPDVESQLEKAVESPWTAAEYPQLADWLKANRAPLDLLVQAADRPAVFLPLVEARNDAFFGATTMSKALMQSYEALRARAMFRLAGKEYEAAARDLLAVAKLARHFSAQFSVMQFLIALSVEGAAQAKLVTLAADPACPAAVRDLVMAWAQTPRPLRRIDFRAEARLMRLQAVMCIARTNLKGPNYEEAMRAGKAAGLEHPGMDWDLILRMANAGQDREDAIAHIADPAARKKAFDAYRAECALEQADYENAGLQLMLNPQGASPMTRPAAWATEKVSRGIALTIRSIHFFNLEPVVRQEAILREYGDLFEVAVALGASRAKNGRFPGQLKALAPEFLKAVPADRFGGGPLLYRVEGKGFVLYSRGPDGKDDGAAEDKPGDDVIIRVK